MVSEVASILALTGGASVALVQSRRHPALLRRLLSLLVAAGLLNLAVLGVSGFLRQGDGFLAAIHALAGHLMLPLVAIAAGAWLGAPLPGIRRRPFLAFLRLLFLLPLCFFCLSNTWTGYFGPSRIDPRVDPETNLRFEVMHCWAVPIVIGTMLLFWLLRLVASPGAIADERSA
jgi:hypothetical protein